MTSLSLGLGLNSLAMRQGGGELAPTKGPICDAIDRLVLIQATYKGHDYVIAPYVVYEAKGGKRLDGSTIERDGKPANKKKLDAFDVAELQGITVSSVSFTPEPGFDPDSAKYLGKTDCVVKVV